MSSVLHVGRRALYHQCPPPLFLTRALPRGLEERQPPFDDEASRLRGDPTLLQRAERTEEACAGPRARAGTTSSGRRDFLNLDGRAKVSPRPVQTPHLRPLDCPASGEKSVLFILKVQMKKQVLRVSLPACLPDELFVLREPQEFHSVWDALLLRSLGSTPHHRRRMFVS